MVDAKLSLATRALIADHTALHTTEVAPNISLTTTFRHPHPDSPAAADPDVHAPHRHIYSRYTTPTLSRTEQVLASVIGQPTLTYPSGISAAWAGLIHYRPDVIAITGGYHGVHGSIEVYGRMHGNLRIVTLEEDFALRGDEKKFLCWLETPLNPTGESRDIAYYARKTHAIPGGKLIIDATFVPPPLQDPFKWGADAVMHSTTKYLAGHSDALGGSISVRSSEGEEEWRSLWHDRTYTGCTPGSLETWLLLRSLRTLELRVNRQADTALALACWLDGLTRAFPGSDLDGPAGIVVKVWHSALTNPALVGQGKQMEKGPATFAILLSTARYAALLPHHLKIFTPATSLGGVESLIEQRVVSDKDEDPRLLRLSIGLESFEDLRDDLAAGMRKVIAEGASKL